MTLQTLPLSKLRIGGANPRKSFDPETIAGLSQSIKTDGLLQNLVVAKPGNARRKYVIVSGERRFRALRLLVENGDLPKDTPVSVVVREDLSEADAHRIATIENIQREDLPPLEEAEAVTTLLQDDMALEDVAAQTGLSERTIKRRLALSALCNEAKQALAAGEIGLAQAEALTLGTETQQRDLIGDGLERISPAQIKHWLTDEKANVAAALFDRAEYTGTLTSDLFASDETTYFDDIEQFWAFQNKAIEALAARYEAEGYDPVETVEAYGFHRWKYRPAREDEKGGVVIQVHDSGLVETHEGLVDLEQERHAVEDTAHRCEEDHKPRPHYSRPLCEYMAMHKSMAVQNALLANPRIAKEVAVVQMIAGDGRRRGVSLSPHDCLRRFAYAEQDPATYAAIEAEARDLWNALGQALDEDGSDICSRLLYSHSDQVAWYEAVKRLSDAQLDRLHLLLTTLCFGQADCSALDTNADSLFNRVAVDLKVDMRAHWTPDNDFLERRSKEQLERIVSDADLRWKIASGPKIKKGDLVNAIAKAFAEAKDADEPDSRYAQARDWLPEAMAFPAIDPDAAEDASGNDV